MRAMGIWLMLAVGSLGCDGMGTEDDPALGENHRNAMSNGLSNCLTNGISNGVTNGLSNGISNGIKNGLSNGISNGLSNGISNGLSNGITNGITNGVSSGGLTQLDAEQQAAKYADYLVQCALSPTQSISFPDRGSVAAHTTSGSLGLATDWYTGVPTVAEQARVSACIATRMNAKMQTMWFTGMGTADSFNTDTIGRAWQNRTCDSGDGYKKVGEIHVQGQYLFTNVFTSKPIIAFNPSSDLTNWGPNGTYNYGTTRICGNNRQCPSNISVLVADSFTTSTSASVMAGYPYSSHPFEQCGGLSLYRHKPNTTVPADVLTYVSCSTVYRTSDNTYCPSKCTMAECTSGLD
jgi:hypothetical protein